jgi:hypothetical protein
MTRNSLAMTKYLRPYKDSAAAADDIYVWLLEAGEAGDFDEAVRIFAKASAILDRLAGARP